MQCIVEARWQSVDGGYFRLRPVVADGGGYGSDDAGGFIGVGGVAFVDVVGVTEDRMIVIDVMIVVVGVVNLSMVIIDSSRQSHDKLTTSRQNRTTLLTTE